MSDHAVLPPSSAHRWVRCPGSVSVMQLYPEQENEHTAEGTAAHWVAEQVLTSYLSNTDVLVASDFNGSVAPNGVVITEEMVEGAQVYITDVLKIANEYGCLSSLQIEQPVKIDRVHSLNWGTPDLRVFIPERARLIVDDFKFGRKVVEVRENWQLIDYAIGALDEIVGGNGLGDQQITVELRVCQPRAFHPDGPCRSVEMNGADLRNYANQLQTAAEQSQLPEPPTMAGEHCVNCPGAHHCLTLQQAAAGICDRIETLNLSELPPAQLAVEIGYLQKAQKLLNARLDAVEAQALQLSNDGTVVPGYAVGYGRGTFKWDKPDSEVLEMGDLMGIDLRKPEAPITPTQAKKLNVDHAVINCYASKHQGSQRLVRVEETVAARVFSNK